MAGNNSVQSQSDVVNAITALYDSASSATQRSEADAWLRAFQKSTHAWAIADALLRDAAFSLDVSLFAAQTLRQKIRYDCDQLSSSAMRFALRDSLLALLLKFRNGPRAVTKQLCLALAAISVHLPDWKDPIATLFEVFHSDWPILVTILAAMPYEFEDATADSSICNDWDKGAEDSSTSTLASSRRQAVIFANSSKVLHSLMMILDKCDASNADIQKHTLDCIRVWIESGDVSLDKVAGTSLVPRCITLIGSPAQDDVVFETAVDVLCEIIRRSGSRLSGKRADSITVMPLVETMYSGLVALAPVLNATISTDDADDERVRNLCRLFVNAGESYLSLILVNVEAWGSVVESILACTSFKELEIVAITFQFWQILTDEVTGSATDPRLKSIFADVYRRLNTVMIQHLHYPLDNTWTAAERDEFREFRHNMGDVLKACVLVLGQEEALARPYSILKEFTINNGGTLDASVPWQRIEAPLFALRTIGRNISDHENKVLPAIMGMLPQLPAHPRVRYSAILVIGRYASWTKLHPEFIPYQMTFISKGFEDNDAETLSAASQALKFLCDECGDRLVGYLEQLHPFYMSIVKVLDRLDRSEVITALAHVIKHVPVQPLDGGSDMLQVLQLFCLPIAQRLHVIGQRGVPAGGFGKDLQVEVADLVDQFTAFVYNAQPKMDGLTVQHPCLVLFREMWPVFDSLLQLKDGKVCNSVCRCIVKCVEAHQEHFKAIGPEVLPRLASAYEVTQYSSLLWAAARCVKKFGTDESSDGALMHTLVETVSRTAFTIVQKSASNVNNVSDTIEDFFLLISAFANACPAHYLQSPMLNTWFECGIACIPIQQFDAWMALFSDYFRSTLELASPFQRARLYPYVTVAIAEPLTRLLHSPMGEQFMQGVILGLAATFPYREDISQEEASGASTVGCIVQFFCDALGGPKEGLRVLGAIVLGMTDPTFKEKDREEFATKLNAALEKRDLYRVDVLMHDYGVKYRRRNHNRKG